MNIIQCLYNETAERLHRQKHDITEYKALVQTFGKTAERFESALNEEQRCLYFEVEAQRNLIGAEDEEWMFQCGFRLGAKLMTEILLLSE